MRKNIKNPHNKYNQIKRFGAMLMASVLTVQAGFTALPGAGLTSLLGGVTAYADSWQGVVKATSLNVRSGAGTGYDSVDTLANNTSVTVISQTTGTDGQVWYQISYGNGKTGYARHDFIQQPVVYSASDASFEAWMNEQGFPESYKNGLRGLHQQYPNWVFKAQHTGLDWNAVIGEESKVGRNLVYKTSKSSWKSIAQGAFDWASNTWPGFDGAAWQAASTEIISHYMDPRNFLSEPYIYQFELQSYNPATQTRDGLLKIVDGTFLAGDALVPLEGSQLTGGTIVEVTVSTSGSGTGGSTGGSSSGSSSGSSTTVGPGADTGNSSTTAGPSGNSGSTSGSVIGNGPGTGTSDGYVSAGPGTGTQTDAVVSGPAAAIGIPGTAAALSEVLSDVWEFVAEAFTGLTSYAAAWKQDAGGWWWQTDDGGYLTGWQWLDGNGDGTAECYYFYDNGYMAVNTEIDGYLLNADGAWVSHDGKTYTKSVSGGTVQTVKMRKIPYVDIIMKAAETSGVSPYVLASMIIQEQGTKGSSDLISGKHGTYPGYYNFYNIGAYAHDGMGAVEAGLKYASESGNGDRPWNSIEKAIIGGASAYGANYVQNGQDTFYLKKFNVQGSNKYNHQYMTNVPAAANEGAHVSEAYSQAVKATALEFKIPVYDNMPQNACPMPAGDGNPNNKLKSVTVDGYTLTPTFNMDTAGYELIVEGSTASVNINAQTIDANAKVSGAGTVNLNVGLNTIKLTVTAENGSTRDYTININRLADGSENSASTGTAGTGPAGTASDPTASGTPGTGESTGVSPGAAPSGSANGPSGSDVIIIG
ncbi:MAG: SH3 domain-containing protein [Eubacteriales bacterium]|nr:SH3 domain-containing protein [Eubacteriales bacterium]